MSDEELLEELTLVQDELRGAGRHRAAKVVELAIRRLAVVTTGVSLANDWAYVYNGEDGE